MICPHCRSNLKRTQRPDTRCSSCKLTFALEPKANAFNLHDVRVGKLTTRLGAERGLRFTERQLWYAAARGRVHTTTPDISGGCLLVGVVLAVGLVMFKGDDGGRITSVLNTILVIGGTALAALGILVVQYVRRARRHIPIRRVPMSFEDFRTLVVQRWAQVYGGPPAGMVDELHTTLPDVRQPRTVLVCPDLSVLVCLAANGAAEAYDMRLVHAPGPWGDVRRAEWARGVPPDVPVIVLHDASPTGLDCAAAVRAAYGDRVVSGGLLPRTVLARTSALRLLEPPLPPDRMERVRAAYPALTEAESEWLADGWWSPLAAVPPAALLAAVARSVERTEGMLDDPSDEELRQARRTGFLTWPTAGREAA